MKTALAIVWLGFGALMTARACRSLRTGEMRAGESLYRHEISACRFWVVLAMHYIAALIGFYMYGHVMNLALKQD